MAGFTNASEAALLDAIWTVLGASGSLWLGLSTTTPTETGSNVTEPSGNAYARVEVTTANFAAAAGGAPSTKANDDVISFPEATGSWGTPTHLTVHNHATAGTCVAWGALTNSQAIASGNTVSIPIGDGVFKLGDPADSY
jgi:hypothetical protein